jgi:hypothetical protein
MYTHAAAFVVPTKPQHAGTHKTAFATTADRNWKDRAPGREDHSGGMGIKGDSEQKWEKHGGGRGRGDNPPQANTHAARDCWGCGETGHILRNCPSVGKADGGESKSGVANVTTLTSSGRDERGSDCDEPPELMSDSDDERWNSDDEESDESDLHEENESIRVRGEARVAYLTGPKTTEWYEVLLDNQANTLIMHPRLLRDIRRTEHPAKVGGVSGHTVNIDLIGYLEGFFDTLAHHDVAASILCMADVEDKYDVTYDAGVSITVHMDSRDLIFHRRNKMYVGDMRDWETYPQSPNRSAMVTTTMQNEDALTKREMKGVQAARDVIRAAGYPTLKEAIHLVEDGNVIGLNVTAADIRKAFEVDSVNGVTPAMSKGKGVNRRTPRLNTDDNLKTTDVKQQLYTDVMHCDDRKCLVSVAEPLHVTLSTPIDRETTHCLGTALQEHIDTLREKGYNPVRVHSDPQRALETLSVRFPGTEIDTQGAGDHLSIVDNKIRRIKELMRCVRADLPWPLPANLIPELVAYAVSRLNLRRTTAAMNQVAPRVALTGWRANGRRRCPSRRSTR